MWGSREARRWQEGPTTLPRPTMSQTILALAAILIFSLFALNRHEADAGRERIAITAEVETAAAGIARARLQEIARRHFDEADIDRKNVRTHENGLTPAHRFGPDGELTEDAYNDVDDFHGATRPQTATWNGQSIRFNDEVTVRYIDPSNPSANPSSSLAKEVTVIVRAAPDGFIGTPPVLARLRRVVTPASRVHIAS